MTAYTTAQAKASDANLAEQTKAAHAAHAKLESAWASIHRLAGDQQYRRRWNMTDEHALERATDAVENDDFRPQRDSEREKIARLATAQADYDAARATLDANTEWADNGRWSRFFLVQDGHIHASTGCHSLRTTTQVFWLPELSGEEVADAVAAHGTNLCTHCFPEAPVAWTTKAPKAADPSLCEGSAKYVPGVDMRRVSKYGTCPTCGQGVSVTSTGKARKHKKAAATV